MFDLENTLIDSWNSGTSLPHKWNHIKALLDTHLSFSDYPSAKVSFGVFSFAVDHPAEVPRAIELAEQTTQYKMNPNLCPCIEDLEKLISPGNINLYGKSHMFDLYTRQFPDADFILFDDALPDVFSTTTRNLPNIQTITKYRV